MTNEEVRDLIMLIREFRQARTTLDILADHLLTVVAGVVPDQELLSQSYSETLQTMNNLIRMLELKLPPWVIPD